MLVKQGIEHPNQCNCTERDERKLHALRESCYNLHRSLYLISTKENSNFSAASMGLLMVLKLSWYIHLRTSVFYLLFYLADER